MLKTIAKKALRRRFGNSSRINIDTIFTNSDIITLAGWMLVDSQQSFEACFGELGESAVVYSYPRPDVEQTIEIKATQICFGFFIALKKQEYSYDFITIQDKKFIFKTLNQAKSINDTTSYLDKLQLASIDNMNKISTQHISAPANFVFSLDEFILIRDKIAFIRGWSNDFNHQVENIIITDGINKTHDLYSSLIRFYRPDLVHVSDAQNCDINNIGFYTSVNIENFDIKNTKLIVTYNTDRTKSFSNITKIGYNQALKFTKSLLSTVNIHKDDFLISSKNHLLPILSNLWEKPSVDTSKLIINNYGSFNTPPEISLIIPIYGRYDFLSHQLSAFKLDEDFRNIEIIYVLDDPKIEREFNIAANGIYETYQIPFKTVFSGMNLGFSGANNLGASIAKGEKLLLLNSDILPSKSGWVTRLSHQFSQLENPGILGTKLVYEDETIQHIGMEFKKDSFYPGIWMNYHPFKGFPDSLIEKFGVKEVASVTGACMLINKDLFFKIGGFDEDYILGDFEDSDLCLKVHRENKKIYITDNEKLYHLERLSQDLVDSGDWKFKLTLINGTRQLAKWNTLIEQLREQYDQ